MTTFFKMPAGSKPSVTVLPQQRKPSEWERRLKEMHDLVAKAKLGNTVIEVAEQDAVRVGKLVEWAPTGKRGLWRVTDLDRWLYPSEVPYKAMKTRIAKIDTAVDDGVTVDGKRILKIRRASVPKGKVRLKWFSGWDGYEGAGHPVIVKIEDVRVLNEMEVLALAVS